MARTWLVQLFSYTPSSNTGGHGEVLSKEPFEREQRRLRRFIVVYVATARVPERKSIALHGVASGSCLDGGRFFNTISKEKYYPAEEQDRTGSGGFRFSHHSYCYTYGA
ncbi:hypothetical protein Pfo_014052 [Paulownia fortunei]|nr:hypothetical protein Pfo_014052 [Paulownia fortunei]